MNYRCAWQVIAASFVGLTALAPCWISAAPLDAKVSINVFSCVKDSNTPPTVRYRANPFVRVGDDLAAAANATSIGSGVWHVATYLPKGRWYVRVLSNHCAANLITTSIDGEERTFLTATFPGDAGPLYHLKGYLAGSLPFSGSAGSIWLSHDCSPINSAPFLTTEGRYFYFEGLWPGDYCLVVAISVGTIIAREVHVPASGAVVRITTEDVEAAIKKAQQP